MASVRDNTSVRSDVRDGAIRQRKRKGGQIADKYHVDAHDIPDGMSYEWKTVTVYGKEDHSYSAMMREQGWEPVDSARHPNMVAEDHKGPIIRDGLMLMERPIELTREAQAEDRANARAMVEIKKQQLGESPDGTMERNLVKQRTTYEAMEID